MTGVGVPLPPPVPSADGSFAVLAPAEASDTADPDTYVPRAGTLTGGWRLITVLTWVGVVLAWAAVWNSSVQLGLSTWWLGARSDPLPAPFRMAPFALPVVTLLGCINNWRRVPLLGLAGALVLAGYGLGDVGRVNRLAVLELLIAAAAALVSLASLTGTYRRPRGEPDR